MFEQVRGVVDVQSGYSNGHATAPSYEDVCTGTTGHAEVVRVRFDPARISLAEILQVFFATHDPTTRNRQGADVGPQYRSGIYWTDESQREVIARVLGEANAGNRRSRGDRGRTAGQLLGGPRLITSITSRNNPEQGYCAAVIGPKLEKFRKVFRRPPGRVIRDQGARRSRVQVSPSSR